MEIITEVPGIIPSTPQPLHVMSSLAGIQSIKFRQGEANAEEE